MNQEDPILDYPQDMDLTAGKKAPPAPVQKPARRLFSPDEGERGKTRTVWAYVLWLTLGVLGAHKFHLGKPQAGFVYCALALLGAGGWLLPFLGSLGAGLSGVSLALLGLFLLIDLFTIPRQVRKRQAQMASPEARWQGTREDRELD